MTTFMDPVWWSFEKSSASIPGLICWDASYRCSSHTLHRIKVIDWLVGSAKDVFLHSLMLMRCGVHIGTLRLRAALLARLPIDMLEIDMAFTHAMVKSPENMAIVSTIISLAHAMRFKTVAEGVETEEQKKLLQLLRCDQMQGFLFSKAVSKPEFQKMLRLR